MKKTKKPETGFFLDQYPMLSEVKYKAISQESCIPPDALKQGKYCFQGVGVDEKERIT